MADFLSSFNLGTQTPAPSNNLSCSSVQDIQLHLRGVLDAKVTPERAEHVSVTLELKSTVRFTLVLSESENGVLENLNNIDPTLGGTRSTPIPMDQSGGQLSRVVDAHETLMNQPQDNPALQRSVAKHIITAVSATDGSTWIVREVSRGTQGWTFTYLCKDSHRQWSRQNAKNPSKVIVGEYSDREPDPVLHNRPAFDCRGLIVVAFNRGSRSITVKYEHTPLHKTVAELAEYFKPPPRQLGPGAQRALQQKTPKKASEKKGEKTKRDSIRAQDEKGNPRKRKKKNDGAPQNAPPPDGPVMPPDYPGAQPLNGELNPSYTNGSHAPINGEQSSQAFNDYPQGLMEGDVSTNAASKPQQRTSQSATGATVPINVSPAEAARRKEVATALLTKNGVAPETLSPEQFNIFANQSPELQKESLNMLVKYGAERLRIVHPSNREGSASATATGNATPIQSGQATPSGPTTTKELVPQSTNKTPVNGPSSTGSAEGASASAQETIQTPTKAKRGAGKSRLACSSCKSRKVKCPKERPICAECLTEGLDCQYPPQKPRSQKKKSEAIVVEDDDEDEEAADETTQLDDSEEQNNTQHEVQDYSSYGQMPVADMLTPSVEHAPRESVVPQPHYFQSASGLALPQPDGSSSIHPQSLHADPYNAGVPPTTQTTEQHQVPAHTDTATSTQRKRATRGSAAASRRSLPSGPPGTISPSMTSVNAQPVSDWSGVSNATIPATNTATVSPQLPQPTVARQRTRQSNKRMSTDISYGMQQAAALSQAALYQQPQTESHQLRDNTQQTANAPQTTMQPQQSPTVAAAIQAAHRTSPFQLGELPRTRSRQSQRTQTRTPVANQSAARDYQASPDFNRQANVNTSNTTQQTAAQTSGLTGYNDYGRYSSANTTSHQSTQQPTYDSYSQQRASSNTSSAARPAEKPSRNAAIARSMASQPPSTMATSYSSNTPTSSQWSGSQSHNTRSYSNNTSSYSTNTSYTQAPTSSTTSTSHQNFNMRGSTAQQPARSDTSYSQQQQQQGYPAYSSQGTQQQNQSTNQHNNWYFNGSSNTSGFTPANQSSGYSWKMPDEGWSNV